MIAHNPFTRAYRSSNRMASGRRNWPPPPPLPLFVFQPLLARIVSNVAGRHPELFVRLGDRASKRFMIDPADLPFFFLLQPDPVKPQLLVHRRGEDVEHDVRISGSFLTLLRMIDNQSDGDAMFFGRELVVSGDTEAVVALRNALDNLDASLADNVAGSFGVLSGPVRAVIDLALKHAGTSR